MVSSFTIALILGLSVVRAHLDINYPLVQYDTDEVIQETGAFCGGGIREESGAWGIGGLNPYVSLSGDPGQKLTVKLSLKENPTSLRDFKYTLVKGAQISESGNFCVDVRIPNADKITPGTFGTLYAEAKESDGHIISACAGVVLVNNLYNRNETAYVGDEPVVIDGHTLTQYEFFCSNSTKLPARDSRFCDCHCHGDEAHCSGACTDEQEEEAQQECEASSG